MQIKNQFKIILFIREAKYFYLCWCWIDSIW